MPISIDNLPYTDNGALEGMWIFQLRQNLNGGHGGTQFQDGRTVTPVDPAAFRRFVATMGNDMVGALRVGASPKELGDVSTLKPESFDELASKSLEAQDSNKLRDERTMADVLGKEREHTKAAHAVAGAKFISADEAKRREEFEKAAGHETHRKTGALVVDAPTTDGSEVRAGGEPVLEENENTGAPAKADEAPLRDALSTVTTDQAFDPNVYPPPVEPPPVEPLVDESKGRKRRF